MTKREIKLVKVKCSICGEEFEGLGAEHYCKNCYVIMTQGVENRKYIKQKEFLMATEPQKIVMTKELLRIAKIPKNTPWPRLKLFLNTLLSGVITETAEREKFIDKTIK